MQEAESAIKRCPQGFLCSLGIERYTQSKIDQILQNQEVSRKGMEMELFLNKCPGIPKKDISKPKNCTDVFM